MADGGITRTREGIPQWSGDAASFQEYEEQALQWEQSVPYHKRALCGPKLIAELSGTARKFITGKRPDWCSYDGGVARLLEHLRNSLGRPQIPELSEVLNRYFRQSRRRRGESMNDYIVRKTELYTRARQSLARVEKHYDGGNWSRQSGSSYQGSEAYEQRYREPWRRTSWAWQDAWATTEEREDQEYHDAEEPGSDTGTYGDSGGWQTWRPWWASSYSEEAPWKSQAPELLPEFLQGWYLLTDAGLDSQERNMIQTAVNGNFSAERIAQELRTQWPEEELRKKDQSSRASSMWQDQGDDDDAGEESAQWTAAGLEQQGMTEEGIALVAEAAQEAEDALAAMEQARRTLREARARQHQVKMSRQYYRVPEKHNEASRKPADKGLKCFRCGGPHKIANCPERGTVGKELASFICYSTGGYVDEQAMTSHGESSGESQMTTEEAVSRGYGILDGGATKTMGSVHALKAIVANNLEKYAEDKILAVDPTDRPTFGFGNSSRDKCASTTELKITAGKQDGILRIHALDKGSGPVLLSVATLRALKAVIDFEEDLIVFRGLDPTQVIQLQRSTSGHQLLPLTEDLYSRGIPSRAVPSLRSYCDAVE